MVSGLNQQSSALSGLRWKAHHDPAKRNPYASAQSTPQARSRSWCCCKPRFTLKEMAALQVVGRTRRKLDHAVKVVTELREQPATGQVT